MAPCEAGLVLGPAGSRPALYASLCLLFGGIPGNSAPGTTNLWNSSHNKLGGRKAHTSSCSTVKWGYALPFPAVSLFVLSSFLPPVRALLCGRLPHNGHPEAGDGHSHLGMAAPKLGAAIDKKMRSLTPNFRKKRFSCFWGQITHIRKKSILSMFDVL